MTLEQYLIKKKISSSKFAEMIDVSRMTVDRYVTGDRIPKKDVMLKIKKATHGKVQPNDFYQEKTS